MRIYEGTTDPTPCQEHVPRCAKGISPSPRNELKQVAQQMQEAAEAAEAPTGKAVHTVGAPDKSSAAGVWCFFHGKKHQDQTYFARKNS